MLISQCLAPTFPRLFIYFKVLHPPQGILPKASSPRPSILLKALHLPQGSSSSPRLCIFSRALYPPQCSLSFTRIFIFPKAPHPPQDSPSPPGLYPPQMLFILHKDLHLFQWLPSSTLFFTFSRVFYSHPKFLHPLKDSEFLTLPWAVSSGRFYVCKDSLDNSYFSP